MSYYYHLLHAEAGKDRTIKKRSCGDLGTLDLSNSKLLGEIMPRQSLTSNLRCFPWTIHELTKSQTVRHIFRDPVTGHHSDLLLPCNYSSSLSYSSSETPVAKNHART